MNKYSIFYASRVSYASKILHFKNEIPNILLFKELRGYATPENIPRELWYQKSIEYKSHVCKMFIHTFFIINKLFENVLASGQMICTWLKRMICRNNGNNFCILRFNTLTYYLGYIQINIIHKSTIWQNKWQ